MPVVCIYIYGVSDLRAGFAGQQEIARSTHTARTPRTHARTHTHTHTLDMDIDTDIYARTQLLSVRLVCGHICSSMRTHM
jgi:hypothetical protein